MTRKSARTLYQYRLIFQRKLTPLEMRILSDKRNKIAAFAIELSGDSAVVVIIVVVVVVVVAVDKTFGLQFRIYYRKKRVHSAKIARCTKKIVDVCAVLCVHNMYNMY